MPLETHLDHSASHTPCAGWILEGCKWVRGASWKGRMKDALEVHYTFKSSQPGCSHTLSTTLFSAVQTPEPQACEWHQLCLKSAAEVCVWACNLKRMSPNEPQMIADPYTPVEWERINHSCRAVFPWVTNQIRVSWDGVRATMWWMSRKKWTASMKIGFVQKFRKSVFIS